MFSKRLARFSFLASLILSCSALSHAQGFQIESKNPPPATASSGTFTSLEGRFTIALPQQISGFSPVSFQAPQGRVTVGDSYSWQLDGAQYEVGYVDKSKTPQASADSRDLMRVLSEGVVAQAAAKEGKVLSNGELTASGLPGREVRLEFPQMYVIIHVIAAADRVYQITAVLKKDPQTLEAATKALDSFKVLTPADVEAAMRKKVEEATPEPLPQEPVAPKAKSDAEDAGLRGKVKTITEEREDLSGTATVQGRRPSSVSYYNERGI